MARDDFNRRRLRGLYERNKRRVTTLADARDRRRSSDSDLYAPRRYIVSEQRTRTEGFGRGGVQIRQVIRRVTRVPPYQMFKSKAIFRRGNRDRFRRQEDGERAILRERFQDSPDGRNRATSGRGRLGDAARRRLRQRQRQPQPQRKPQQIGRGNGNKRNGESDRGGSQTKKRPVREKLPTREQLDAELDKFRAN